MKTRIQLRNEARILDAAQEVFATYGYHGATIDEVAERALEVQEIRGGTTATVSPAPPNFKGN